MGQLRDNQAAGRLEMDEQGQVVFATYRRSPGRLIIDHVEAPPSLRGSGASGRFMEALAKAVKACGEKITPVCGYAHHWLASSAEYRDLIA